MAFFNSVLKCYSKNFRNVTYIQRHGMRFKSKLLSQETYSVFQDSLPVILNNILYKGIFYELPEIAKRLERITGYCVTGGKNLRGTLTLYAYEMLEKPENITKETLHQACVLAWGAEMFQAYFVMLDDIQDSAKTRRGRTCWHLLPDIGTQALNDASMLRSFLFSILKQNITDQTKYSEISNIFNEAFLYTAIGQHLDSNISKIYDKSYTCFTSKNLNTIFDNKSSYYTFKFPIFLALALSNKFNTRICQNVEKICNNLGRLFQIQDDYIDCFGEFEITGKEGTDIQEGKCTWLAVTALQQCNPIQRNVFTTCYGSKEPAHVERIKQLYQQLKLPELYRQQEEALYNVIVEQAEALPDMLLPTLFVKIAESIYKRKS